MIWRRQQVEDLALILLLDFRRRTGRALGPPVDVELLGEITCGLRWDWEVIPEAPNTRVWAALFPTERRVVLNETHRDTFADKPGLERFTRAHEIGHWLLHVEAGRWHLEEDKEIRSRENKEPRYADSQQLAPTLSGSARPWIERHADWFAASLLMPAALFVPAVEDAARRGRLDDWKTQSRLAYSFGVTPTALRVRLNDLKLLVLGG